MTIRNFDGGEVRIENSVNRGICSASRTLTQDNTSSNNTSNSSKPGATQFSIGSFELVY